MSGVNWWLMAVGNVFIYTPFLWWFQQLEAAVGHVSVSGLEFGVVMALCWTFLDWQGYRSSVSKRVVCEGRGEIVEPITGGNEKLRTSPRWLWLYAFSAIGIISSLVRFFYSQPSVSAIFLYATLLPLLIWGGVLLKIRGLSTGILAQTEPLSHSGVRVKGEASQEQVADAEMRRTAPEEPQKLELRR